MVDILKKVEPEILHFNINLNLKQLLKNTLRIFLLKNLKNSIGL